MKDTFYRFIFAIMLGLWVPSALAFGQNGSTTPVDSVQCARGVAEPIIRKKIYPGTTFQIQADGTSALESVTLATGDKLIIRHWGCEYYCQTYRFETTRYKADTADMQYWYGKAVLLMGDANKAVQSVLSLNKGIARLKKQIAQSRTKKRHPLQLQEELDYNASEMRTFVAVDRVEKMSGDTYAIEIIFAYGPL